MSLKLRIYEKSKELIRPVIQWWTGMEELIMEDCRLGLSDVSGHIKTLEGHEIGRL